MIVLDTDVVSALLRPTPDEDVRAWLDSSDEKLTTTVITVMEIEYGIARLATGRRRNDLAMRFEALVGPNGVLEALSFDDAAARRAGEFRARRAAQGRPVAQPDMMIAGIATEVGASLATRNARDFDGLGLRILTP